ncbi:MAG: hypothetical protein M1818_004571 [Claussenomyces sp. TS43310]|nr:MAG: hypothetical protein M1818_004571 [Claussenomyces sp. TS43310]
MPTSKMEKSMLTPSRPKPPIRILVQTLTHLIPGRDSFERIFFILNGICQNHWNCDFKGPQFRYAVYNGRFGLNNQRCFFLVDHGESENDDDVPVLYYEWTGESLKPLPQLAKNPKIQAKLKHDVPFTRQPSKHCGEKRPMREVLKQRLYCADHLRREEIDYIREHPEDAEWLKAHLYPRFWRKLEALINATKPPVALSIEEIKVLDNRMEHAEGVEQ